MPDKQVSLKSCAVLFLTFVVGFGAALGFVAYSSVDFTDDELAKLAELAACSTGQPASALWLKAKTEDHWYTRYRIEVARQFLVDIDIDRCSVRKTANADTGHVKIRTLSPSNRHN